MAGKKIEKKKIVTIFSCEYHSEKCNLDEKKQPEKCNLKGKTFGKM